MALVSVDPVTKSAAILSIPRDLWVQVPDGRGGWTIDRLNEAYHTGEMGHLSGGGGETAAAAVTHNFGIPIDYYVALDFAGFTSLVDALGGIDVAVPGTLTATVLLNGTPVATRRIDDDFARDGFSSWIELYASLFQLKRASHRVKHIRQYKSDRRLRAIQVDRSRL